MIQDGLFDVDRVAGQNVFSQKCLKVVIAGSPLHNSTSATCILLCLLNHRESKGEDSLLHFVENVASARHFQPLSDEENDVLLPDSCAISCSDRLW